MVCGRPWILPSLKVQTVCYAHTTDKGLCAQTNEGSTVGLMCFDYSLINRFTPCSSNWSSFHLQYTLCWRLWGRGWTSGYLMRVCFQSESCEGNASFGVNVTKKINVLRSRMPSRKIGTGQRSHDILFAKVYKYFDLPLPPLANCTEIRDNFIFLKILVLCRHIIWTQSSFHK